MTISLGFSFISFTRQLSAKSPLIMIQRIPRRLTNPIKKMQDSNMSNNWLHDYIE